MLRRTHSAFTINHHHQNFFYNYSPQRQLFKATSLLLISKQVQAFRRSYSRESREQQLKSSNSKATKTNNSADNQNDLWTSEALQQYSSASPKSSIAKQQQQQTNSSDINSMKQEEHAVVDNDDDDDGHNVVDQYSSASDVYNGVMEVVTTMADGENNNRNNDHTQTTTTTSTSRQCHPSYEGARRFDDDDDVAVVHRHRKHKSQKKQNHDNHHAPSSSSLSTSNNNNNDQNRTKSSSSSSAKTLYGQLSSAVLAQFINNRSFLNYLPWVRARAFILDRLSSAISNSSDEISQEFSINGPIFTENEMSRIATLLRNEQQRLREMPPEELQHFHNKNKIRAPDRLEYICEVSNKIRQLVAVQRKQLDAAHQNNKIDEMEFRRLRQVLHDIDTTCFTVSPRKKTEVEASKRSNKRFVNDFEKEVIGNFKSYPTAPPQQLFEQLKFIKSPVKRDESEFLISSWIRIKRKMLEHPNDNRYISSDDIATMGAIMSKFDRQAAGLVTFEEKQAIEEERQKKERERKLKEALEEAELLNQRPAICQRFLRLDFANQKNKEAWILLRKRAMKEQTLLAPAVLKKMIVICERLESEKKQQKPEQQQQEQQQEQKQSSATTTTSLFNVAVKPPPARPKPAPPLPNLTSGTRPPLPPSAIRPPNQNEEVLVQKQQQQQPPQQQQPTATSTSTPPTNQSQQQQTKRFADEEMDEMEMINNDEDDDNSTRMQQQQQQQQQTSAPTAQTTSNDASKNITANDVSNDAGNDDDIPLPQATTTKPSELLQHQRHRLFCLACVRGDIQTVTKMFKESSASIASSNNNNNTKNNNMTLDVNKASLWKNEYSTPLQLAAANGRLAVTEFLLSPSVAADINRDTNTQRVVFTPEKKILPETKRVVTDLKATKIEINETALMRAARTSNLLTCKLLIAKGAICGRKTIKMAGSKEVSRFLKDPRRDQIAQDWLKREFFTERKNEMDMLVLQEGDRQKVQQLVEFSGGADYRNLRGETLLHLAARCCAFPNPTVSYLVEVAGVDIDAVDDHHKSSAFEVAVRFDNHEVAKYLAAHGGAATIDFSSHFLAEDLFPKKYFPDRFSAASAYSMRQEHGDVEIQRPYNEIDDEEDNVGDVRTDGGVRREEGSVRMEDLDDFHDPVFDDDVFANDRAGFKSGRHSHHKAPLTKNGTHQKPLGRRYLEEAYRDISELSKNLVQDRLELYRTLHELWCLKNSEKKK